MVNLQETAILLLIGATFLFDRRCCFVTAQQIVSSEVSNTTTVPTTLPIRSASRNDDEFPSHTPHLPTDQPSTLIKKTPTNAPSPSEPFDQLDVTSGPSSSPTDQRSMDDNDEEIPVDANIVGGSPAVFGQYPFYVWAYPGLCGGTLIHEDIVLTAAHCTCDLFLNSFLYIGGTFITGTDAADSTFALSCIIHPGYDPDIRGANDIMLLQLSSRSNEPLVTMNFDDTVPVVNDVVTVIGYGDTVSGSNTSQETLLEVDLDIFDDAICDSIYTPPGRDYEPAVNLCAGTVLGGRDSCQGDSGGPLLTVDNVQIGIVSYGFGCGDPNVPAAYTKVAAYEQWINDNICELSAKPPTSCADRPTVSPTPDTTPDPTPVIATPYPTFDTTTVSTPSNTNGCTNGGNNNNNMGGMKCNKENQSSKGPKEIHSSKGPKEQKATKGGDGQMKQKQKGGGMRKRKRVVGGGMKA